MKASLDVLGTNKGRKIAVLGDMKELGEKSYELHTGLKEAVEKNNIDLVFTIGEEMKQLFDVLPTEKQGCAVFQTKDVILPLKNALKDGDTVLIKGSNSMKMSAILEALK